MLDCADDSKRQDAPLCLRASALALTFIEGCPNLAWGINGRNRLLSTTDPSQKARVKWAFANWAFHWKCFDENDNERSYRKSTSSA